MNKSKFLTVGWNNILTLVLGLPALGYLYAAYSNGFWREKGGLIGLAVIGVLYWLVLEGHTAMRFAWLKENAEDYHPVVQSYAHPLALVRKLYNLAFWVFLLPFFTVIDYRTGFIAFAVIIIIRLVLNLVTNNLLHLTPGQYEGYPFRI